MVTVWIYNMQSSGVTLRSDLPHQNQKNTFSKDPRYCSNPSAPPTLTSNILFLASFHYPWLVFPTCSLTWFHADCDSSSAMAVLPSPHVRFLVFSSGILHSLFHEMPHSSWRQKHLPSHLRDTHRHSFIVQPFPPNTCPSFVDKKLTVV